MRETEVFLLEKIRLKGGNHRSLLIFERMADLWEMELTSMQFLTDRIKLMVNGDQKIAQFKTNVSEITAHSWGGLSQKERLLSITESIHTHIVRYRSCKVA